MKVKQLIAQLSELDPEEDIYAEDSEYDPEPIRTLVQSIVNVETANGRHLPKMVWCVSS